MKSASFIISDSSNMNKPSQNKVTTNNTNIEKKDDKSNNNLITSIKPIKLVENIYYFK